jgi:hypothetical protein
MSRRHLVATLPDDEREFIITSYIGGCKTARALSAAYKQQFKKPLSKSSVQRWLSAIGEDLIEKYDLQNQVANQIVANLKNEGLADKHAVIIENIRNWSLTGLHDLITADPLALIKIQQEEKKREQKDREIQLKERAQSFTEEQVRKSEQLQHDRLAIALDVWKFIYAYLLKEDPAGADVLTKHNDKIINGLEEHLENQTA